MARASAQLDALTDAVARGRLALAEVALIPPRELDAMFELAAQYLDTGRDTEATTVLGGLVALFPFSSRFWRAYGVALHRQLEVSRARAAYEAALALEPSHELTRCYLTEILMYLGETEVARRELETLQDAADPVVRHRAARLLLGLPELSTVDWRAPAPPEDVLEANEVDPPRFTIGGKRELPLLETQFLDGDDTVLLTPEVTTTARLFAPLFDESTESFDVPPEAATPTVTQTAIIRHRRSATTTKPTALEVTDTALLPKRNLARTRASAGRAITTESPDQYATAAAQGSEPTQTAIMRRRQRLPLEGDDATSIEREATSTDGGVPPCGADESKP